MKTNRSVSKIKITDIFPRDAPNTLQPLEAAHSWWLSRAVPVTETSDDRFR
jgi:hypothetical protein